jgi:uncharacterized protein (TIGR04255 family)
LKDLLSFLVCLFMPLHAIFAENMERLKKPPLREALWEVQFTPSVALETIHAFGQQMQDLYPIQHDTASVQINIGNEGVVHGEQIYDGIRLSHPERPFVVLLKTNLLVVARLRPYESFEDLQAEALRIVSAWMNFVTEISLNQLTLRYVNEYFVRFEDGDFIGDYIQLAPFSPTPGFPEQIDSYTIQLRPVYDPDKQSLIAVSFQPELGNTQTHRIVLDIAVGQANAFQQDLKALAEVASALRKLKNKIFEHMIGPKAFAQFNH